MTAAFPSRRRLLGHAGLAVTLWALMAGPGSPPASPLFGANELPPEPAALAEAGGPSALFDGAAPTGERSPAAVKESGSAFALPFGPWGVPKNYQDMPSGCGPVSSKARPGYLKGLAGGLWGLVAAPVAFVLESVQAVGLAPVRMVAGVIEGDPLSLLDPLRRVKGLSMDVPYLALGLLNCASAPVWNVAYPDEATDFVYANDRLVFIGGPASGLMAVTRRRGVTPSWHTVAIRRGNAIPQPWWDDTYAHELVHNWQHKESWWPWSERISERFESREDYSGAHRYLNW